MKQHESGVEPDSTSGINQEGTTQDSMTVFMCEECNAVFLNQDSLAVHILAEHMKKGWTAAGGAAQSENDAAGHSQVPQSSLEETEVSDGVYGDSQVVVELPECEGRVKSEMQEAVETLVTISDPSSQQRTVTLIHPSPTKGGNFVTTHHAMEVENEEIVAGEEVPYVSTYSSTVSEAEGRPARVSTQNVEVQEVIDLPHTEHGQELIINNSGGEGDQETFVTFTDPNTNQEYMLAVESDTIANLLSTTVAVESSDKDQQECVAVAETVEIAEASSNSRNAGAAAARATASLADSPKEAEVAWTTHEIVMEELQGSGSQVETQLSRLVTQSSESPVTQDMTESQTEISQVTHVVTQGSDSQVVTQSSNPLMTHDDESQVVVQKSESSVSEVITQTAESLVTQVMTQADQAQANQMVTQSDESQIAQGENSQVSPDVAEGDESKVAPAADASEIPDEVIKGNESPVPQIE